MTKNTTLLKKSGSVNLSLLREGARPLEIAVGKVSGAPLVDVVYEVLEHVIRRGEFTPGQSLKLRALARALGTSLTPVREALSRLVAKKALEFHPVNRSVIVPLLTIDDVREIYAIRILLEGMASEMVARSIRASDLSKLIRLRMAVEKSAKANASHQFLHHNEVFLFAIYELAHRPRILDFIRTLWLQIGPTMAMLLTTVDNISSISGLQGYKDLLIAFRKHDGHKAREIVSDRLGQICELICTQLESLQIQQV